MMSSASMIVWLAAALKHLGRLLAALAHDISDEDCAWAR